MRKTLVSDILPQISWVIMLYFLQGKKAVCIFSILKWIILLFVQKAATMHLVSQFDKTLSCNNYQNRWPVKIRNENILTMFGERKSGAHFDKLLFGFVSWLLQHHSLPYSAFHSSLPGWKSLSPAPQGPEVGNLTQGVLFLTVPLTLRASPGAVCGSSPESVLYFSS